MQKMMLHCGAAEVDWPQLEAVPLPLSTKTYCPIPHVQLISSVERSLMAAGFEVTGQGHALTNDGANYFGVMELRNGREHDDYATIVGLRNSHAKKFPAGIACGSRVFVCDNLAFSGEIVIKRRHTRFIERDLPTLIHTAVGRLSMLRADMDTRIERYKATELGRDYADHLIVEMLRAQVITSTKIPAVLKEWEEPSHPEFAERLNVWRLFNAVTESLKGFVPDPRRTQALHGLMDGAVGGVTLAGEYETVA